MDRNTIASRSAPALAQHLVDRSGIEIDAHIAGHEVASGAAAYVETRPHAEVAELVTQPAAPVLHSA